MLLLAMMLMVTAVRWSRGGGGTKLVVGESVARVAAVVGIVVGFRCGADGSRLGCCSCRGRKQSNETSSCWSKNLMAIASTIVISLEMGDIVSNINGLSFTMAKASEEVAMETQFLSLTDNNNNNKSVTRWSDKRSCPSWHINSLETIVPENLHRPDTQRKWEGVVYSSKYAPSVKFLVIKPRTSCFSL